MAQILPDDRARQGPSGRPVLLVLVAALVLCGVAIAGYLTWVTMTSPSSPQPGCLACRCHRVAHRKQQAGFPGRSVAAAQQREQRPGHACGPTSRDASIILSVRCCFLCIAGFALRSRSPRATFRPNDLHKGPLHGPHPRETRRGGIR